MRLHPVARKRRCLPGDNTPAGVSEFTNMPSKFIFVCVKQDRTALRGAFNESRVPVADVLHM